MVPLRDLLTEHAQVMAAPGRGIVHRIDHALEFADKLMASNPAFARVNPQVPERLKRLKEQNRNYLAHEYFNHDWLPMPFSRMAQWLEATKVSYACSAHYLDHIDALNLSPEQMAVLGDIPDEQFRQTVRDFCVNQQFRKDYWVKGARTLNAVEQLDAIRASRVVLVMPRGDVSLKATGGLGEATMQESVYAPILDVLADHRVRTIGEIEQAVASHTNFAQLLQAVMVLIGNGSLYNAQDSDTVEHVKEQCHTLNHTIIEKARGSADINYLASPVTGGGITVGRFQQLFLISYLQGSHNTQQWAEFVWGILSSRGQRIVKEGQTLESAQDNLVELQRQADEFLTKYLPILHALHVI